MLRNFVNADSDIVTFLSYDVDFVIIDLNNTNLNDHNLMKMILKLLFMLDLWLFLIYVNNTRHVKKTRKELVPVAWHPTR